MGEHEDRPLGLEEAADFLGIHPATLRRRVKQGVVRGYTLGEGGRRLFFKKADLLAALVPVEPVQESED